MPQTTPALNVKTGLPLDRIVALFVILQLILTGAVVALGRDYHGFKRGACLSYRARTMARLTSAALLFVVSCNSVLIVWRLVVDPEALVRVCMILLGALLHLLTWVVFHQGNKDELSLTAAALGALLWSDVLLLRPRVRRRRRIAELLAQMPTFRLGQSGWNSPLDEAFSANEFVIRSARWSVKRDSCTRVRRSRTINDDDDGDDNDAGAPPGQPQSYWRGTVARVYQHHEAFNGAPGGIVVLSDDTCQDEAGCDLLSPEFTHKPALDRQMVVQVAWRALKRAQVRNIGRWRPGFMEDVKQTLQRVRAVDGILKGELGRCIDWDEHDNAVERLLWAAIVVELMKFLDAGRSMLILPAFAKAPSKVSETAKWDGSELLAAMSDFAKAD